jgi:hypothetical protein
MTSWKKYICNVGEDKHKLVCGKFFKELLLSSTANGGLGTRAKKHLLACFSRADVRSFH